MKNLIIVIFIITVCSCSYQAKSQTLAMNIVPKVDTKKKEAFIEFHLTYEGSEPISVDMFNLLGKRIARSISFQADIALKFGERSFVNCPIPDEKIFIDDPGLGHVLVQPGETLTQKIDLYQVFDKFDQIVGKCDFIFGAVLD